MQSWYRGAVVTALAALVVIATAPQLFAVAEAGVPSLIIPPGARANGMGESYVALSLDATAGWWNAGGLAFVKGRNFAFMHSQLVPDLAPDVYYEFLGYSTELKGVGTLAFSVVYLTYGESIATSEEGNVLGTFNSNEVSGVASFAMPLGENLGAGLSVKFIRVDYAPAEFTVEKEEGSGTSFAVDFGALYRNPERKLSIGASVANLGPEISFIDREQSDPLPITFRGGVAYTLMDDDVSQLLAAFEIEQSLVWLVDSDTDKRRSEIWHVGAEYRYVNLLAGRIGYVYDDDGDFSAPTYGLGFIYKEKLSLDYANVPQAEALDRVHRWSVYFSF
jgi:hypothetical protein